jgi:hypothetical protein
MSAQFRSPSPEDPQVSALCSLQSQDREPTQGPPGSRRERCVPWRDPAQLGTRRHSARRGPSSWRRTGLAQAGAPVEQQPSDQPPGGPRWLRKVSTAVAR